MSCFYCGKRVSLVRKRNDADFCCNDHREKYNARTRRSMEVLAEDEERMVVTRRLTEGFPLRANVPCHGTELDELMMRNPGKPLPFTSRPTGLPVSRVQVATHIPAATTFSFRTAGRDGDVPPPLAEPACWSFGRMQESPRPPPPFMFTIMPPAAGPVHVSVRQAACDGPRHLRPAPPVELGAWMHAVLAPRLDRRPSANSMGALMQIARAPDPVKPPPPSPPIVATLRHPVMAISLGRPPTSRISIRLPQLGMVGINYEPTGTAQRAPAPAYVLIVRRTLAIPSVRLIPGGMVHSREPKGMTRLVPCPEGFRRKQYYNWETPERFLGMGFLTIAGHRPETRIAAAPYPVPQLDVTRIWATPLNDGKTALPDKRLPAQPFRECLELPGAIAILAGTSLRKTGESQAKIGDLDSIERLPQSATWDVFSGAPPVHHQGGLSGISPAEWASGTAESLAIAAWARPQTRGAKRTSSHVGIAARTPVFAGPTFLAGLCQAGPTPEFHQPPPRFEPRAAEKRSERVDSRRDAILPATPDLAIGLRQTAILPEGCQVPIGNPAANAIVHPPHPIGLKTKLPPGHLRAAVAGGLRSHPPAKQNGATFDIAKGSPKRLERETLERLRQRGYETLHSEHTTPYWPAPSTPGLLAPEGNAPCPHPSRQPDLEIAAPIYRACDRPAVEAFRRACTLFDWGTVPAAMPGWTDWGKQSHPAIVPLTLPVVLPIDPHGPIRDWGLAPPPEPEKPPEPIHEDFAGGLANWLCANADWRQDIAGVRTGSLALLQPSLLMQDYELEFLGKIENQSIGCVFRASNTSNYHAAQIALDGSSGTARLVRFSVVAGNREPPVSELFPVALTKRASCRVRVSVSGNDFKIFLNDQPAGEWSDDRLPRGGIGFFSEPDDRARLYWVKVTPYYEGPADDLYAPMAPLRSEIHREIRMGV